MPQGAVRDEDGGAGDPSLIGQEGTGCLFLAHQGAGAYKVMNALLVPCAPRGWGIQGNVHLMTGTCSTLHCFFNAHTHTKGLHT
jgi:hypothetical protein